MRRRRPGHSCIRGAQASPFWGVLDGLTCWVNGLLEQPRPAALPPFGDDEKFDLAGWPCPLVVCLLGPVEPDDREGPGRRRLNNWNSQYEALRTIGHRLIGVSSEPTAQQAAWLADVQGWPVFGDPELRLARSLDLPTDCDNGRRVYRPAAIVLERQRTVNVSCPADANDAEAITNWLSIGTVDQASEPVSASE